MEVENSKRKVQLTIDRDVIIPTLKDGIVKKEVITPKFPLALPVNEGDSIGNLIISNDKEILAKYPMKAKNSVSSKKITDFIKGIF